MKNKAKRIVAGLLLAVLGIGAVLPNLQTAFAEEEGTKKVSPSSSNVHSIEVKESKHGDIKFKNIDPNAAPEEEPFIVQVKEDKGYMLDEVTLLSKETGEMVGYAKGPEWTDAHGYIGVGLMVPDCDSELVVSFVKKKDFLKRSEELKDAAKSSGKEFGNIKNSKEDATLLTERTGYKSAVDLSPGNTFSGTVTITGSWNVSGYYFTTSCKAYSGPHKCVQSFFSLDLQGIRNAVPAGWTLSEDNIAMTQDIEGTFECADHGKAVPSGSLNFTATIASVYDDAAYFNIQIDAPGPSYQRIKNMDGKLLRITRPPKPKTAFIKAQKYVGTLPITSEIYVPYGHSNKKQDAYYNLLDTTHAAYRLYTDPACTNEAKDVTGTTATLWLSKYSKSGGYLYSQTLEMEPRTYYIKEVANPIGHGREATVHTVTLTTGHTETVPYVCQSKDSVKSGTIEIQKTSNKPDVTENNEMYSMEGAVYTVYSDISCEDAYKVGEIRIDETGFGHLTGLAFGQYWVKETTAGKNYELDLGKYPVTLQE